MLPFREPGSDSIWYRPKPYFKLEEDRLVLHNQPVPNERFSDQEILKRRASSFGGISPFRLLILRASEMPQWMSRINVLQRISLALGQPFRGYESEDSAAWQLMRAIIKRFVRQASGKIVFILPLPNRYHFVGNLAPTYLERFAALEDHANSCFVPNVLPYFKRLSSENRKKCYFPGDWHYTPFGHSVVADCLSDALAKHCSPVLD
jgi:hypothetical protein